MVVLLIEAFAFGVQGPADRRHERKDSGEEDGARRRFKATGDHGDQIELLNPVASW